MIRPPVEQVATPGSLTDPAGVDAFVALAPAFGTH